MGGRAALDHVSDLLALKVEVRGLENLPGPVGSVVIVANHPTGIADGVAVYDALKARGPTSSSTPMPTPCASAPLRRGADPGRVGRGQAQPRAHAPDAVDDPRALEAERALVIFPAGRLAMEDEGRLTDPPWMTSAVSIARKYDAPIVPIHLTGPGRPCSTCSTVRFQELRDITLFHELLNKRGRRFSLIVGAPIAAEALPDDTAMATGGAEALCRARDLPRTPTGDDDRDFLPDEAATQAWAKSSPSPCAPATPSA
jgi:1-acyl-sn-glycerol-3-phosphate acyltransferase